MGWRFFKILKLDAPPVSRWKVAVVTLPWTTTASVLEVVEPLAE